MLLTSYLNITALGTPVAMVLLAENLTGPVAIGVLTRTAGFGFVSGPITKNPTNINAAPNITQVNQDFLLGLSSESDGLKSVLKCSQSLASTREANASRVDG